MKKEIKKFISFFYKKEVETNDSISWDCFYDILGKGLTNCHQKSTQKYTILHKSTS